MSLSGLQGGDKTYIVAAASLVVTLSPAASSDKLVLLSSFWQFSTSIQIQEFQKVSSTDQVKVYVSCRKKWPCREDLPCNMFEVREIQLRLPRDQTAAYTAIMDQYLTNIMLHLKKELTTGDGDVETTLKLWRQYHNTLATVVTPGVW